jgi:GH25 family lysozyme M1 (1,4-beta-N-acetylmuramidase)
MVRRSLVAVSVLLAFVATGTVPSLAEGRSGRNMALSHRASDGAVPSSAAPAAVVADSSWLEGIDVSHWNGTIDWAKVASSGRRFAFMKATEGTTFRDPTYAENRQGAVAAGLVVTAYHFARPDLNPGGAVAEANHFADVAGIGAGDIIPVLDLERDGGLSPAALIDWAEDSGK